MSVNEQSFRRSSAGSPVIKSTSYVGRKSVESRERNDSNSKSQGLVNII